MKSSYKKEVKSVIKAAEKQGWRAELTKNGHWRLYAPDGKNIVHAPGTASDHRGLKNTIAQMKRYGFKWK